MAGEVELKLFNFVVSIIQLVELKLFNMEALPIQLVELKLFNFSARPGFSSLYCRGLGMNILRR